MKRSGQLRLPGDPMKKLCIFLLLTSLLMAPVSALEDTAVAGTGTDAFYGNESISALSGETGIGGLCADAARTTSGADIALLNSGDIGGNLVGGEITYGDCKRIFNEDRTLAVITVSPARLKDILEVGVSHIVMNEEEMIDREVSAWGGFPQISGFEFSYDVAALAGSRVHEITMDGVVLDLTDSTTQITLCATEYMLSGGWGYGEAGGGEPVGCTLSEALFRHIRREGTVTPPTSLDRIRSRGSKDGSIWDSLKVTPLLLVIALLIYGGGRTWHYDKYQELEHEPRERKY